MPLKHTPRKTSTPKNKSKFGNFVDSLRSGGAVTRSKSKKVVSTPDLPDPNSEGEKTFVSQVEIEHSEEMTENGGSSGTGGGGHNEKNGGFKLEKGDTKYKDVITWIRPFDGTKTEYIQFSNDCDRAFKAVEEVKTRDLINFVLTKLPTSKFAFTLGTDFVKWEELKKALDEHFRIRLNEKFLFRELTDMTKGKDDLFSFYNRLIAKCYEYKTFLESTFKDKGLDFINFRVQQAEEYALDSFIMAVGMNFRAMIRDKKPKNIQEAYSMLRDLEIGTGCNSSDSTDDKLSEVLNLLKLGNSNNNNNNFTKPNINRVEEEGEKAKDAMNCQFCGKIGHTAPKCYKMLNMLNNNNPTSNNNSNGNAQKNNVLSKFNFKYNNKGNNRGGFNNNFDGNSNHRNFINQQGFNGNNGYQANPRNNYYQGHNNNGNWQGGEFFPEQQQHLSGNPQARSGAYYAPQAQEFYPMGNYGGQVRQVEYATQPTQPQMMAICPGGVPNEQGAGGSPMANENHMGNK